MNTKELKNKSDELLKQKVYEILETFFTKQGLGKKIACDKSLINSLQKELDVVLSRPTLFDIETKRKDLMKSLKVWDTYSPEHESTLSQLHDLCTDSFFWLNRKEQSEFCATSYELEEQIENEV
jgi:hypothetical protein